MTGIRSIFPKIRVLFRKREGENSAHFHPLVTCVGKANYQKTLEKMEKMLYMHSTLCSTEQTSISIILDSIYIRFCLHGDGIGRSRDI